MLERAKMVDAILTVESARGRGTMIHVEVPVGKKEG
jgi:signal transduction histidine kinase